MESKQTKNTQLAKPKRKYIKKIKPAEEIKKADTNKKIIVKFTF
jgi:hypothetical protein